ncbi:acetyltransferase [Dictyobacter kobayashii]|uniref:Acetyltransferase n=1 Tax=Dictyobacter kobayashii TaxID=2014872 RepID=A0A402AEZ6_9CHLR|nr:acetyltransferase [Dictyobacter kobayashii]
MYIAQGLSQEELAAIGMLAEECNAYEQLDLKLNWVSLQARPKNEINDFLYYEQGKLVGYLPIFCFNAQEAEVSGMVAPDWRRRGIFTTLLEAARKECQRRQLPSLLFIVENQSASGQAFVAALKPQYDHSEYKMAFRSPQPPALSASSPLQFRQAGVDDRAILQSITAAAFAIPEEEVDWYSTRMLNDDRRTFYVASIDDVAVGKIDVFNSTHDAYIAGVGVLPQYQKRGYGRQILIYALHEILKSGQKNIVLEVAVENEHALGLYTSCGFTQLSRYDYYRLTI